jgi:hypothetical protein
MKDMSIILEPNDSSSVIDFSDNTYKVSKFIQIINKSLNSLAYQLKETMEYNRVYINEKDYEKIFQEGIECEILKVGNNDWQQGKVRIKVALEFCPDEPEMTELESPLDDIRRRLNEVNS